MALTKIPSSLLDTSSGFDLQGNITLGDNEQIQLGDSTDLAIYHDGSHSYIKDTGTGNLFIDATSLRLRTGAGTENYLVAEGNGAVTLYYDNNPKIATSSTGATVTGNLAVTGDLDITGNVNSYNVTDLDVTDQTITLGAGQTEANSGGSGIIIDGSNASILWDETNDTFDINKGLTALGNIEIGTDSNGANISLKNSSYGNTGLARFYGTDGNEKLQIGANANTQAVLYTFSGVSLDFEIGTNANTLHLKSTGEVSIGGDTTTASGLNNLSIGAYADTGSGIVLRATTASALNFEDNSSVTAARVYYNHTDGYMSFNTEQAERMRITSVGDVSIGGVTPQGLSGSARELTIGTTGDTANDGGGVAFTHNSVLGSYVLGQKQAMTIAHYIDGSPIYFRTNNGGTHGTRMTIASSGDISMGSSTAATAYFSIDKATTGENGILFKNAGTNKIKLIQSAAEELEVYVNTSTLALVIAESGIADFRTTKALRLPRGTTSQRPTGAAGYIRYNETTDKYEVYDYGASQWTDIKTSPSISFVNPTTYFTDRFAISSDGQSADADNTSGYGVVSTNINFEGNFTLITKWAHDYMGIGIAFKAGIQNSNFTGESTDSAGPYGGNSGVDGFDSTVSYMGQYHWPVSGGGNDDHQTTWYIKHQRSGNTISTHYSTNSNAADDPAHSSWTQVQSTTINTSDHCKPVWGEASSNENQILTFTYKDVTGGYNFS